jgi:hypothetical protein
MSSYSIDRPRTESMGSLSLFLYDLHSSFIRSSVLILFYPSVRPVVWTVKRVSSDDDDDEWREEKQQLTYRAIFLESRSRTMNNYRYKWQNENIEGHVRLFFSLFISYIFVFKGRVLVLSSILKLYDKKKVENAARSLFLI